MLISKYVLRKIRNYNEPITECSICGEPLFNDRYRAVLIHRKYGIVFRQLYLCPICFNIIRSDKEIKRLFKIRYRKMRKLRASYSFLELIRYYKRLERRPGSR